MAMTPEHKRKIAEALDKAKVSIEERGGAAINRGKAMMSGNGARKKAGVGGQIKNLGRDLGTLGKAAVGSVKSEVSKKLAQREYNKSRGFGALKAGGKLVMASGKDMLADRATNKAKENVKTDLKRIASKSKSAAMGAVATAQTKASSAKSFAKQNIATRGGNTKTKVDDKAYALAGKVKRAPGKIMNAAKQNVATRGANTKTKLDDKAYALASKAKRKIKSWMS